jgi:uncharacterized protein YhfF
MMETSAPVKEFWQIFCAASGTPPATPFQVWYFGNSPEMAAELAALVISGKKCATASQVEYNELHPEAAPVADGYSVVTDFEGAPRCVIRTAEIRQIPFDEVDAEFASDEGEGDQSLEYWREVHRAYFVKEAAENNLEFNERSLVCCERFKLLFPK